MKKATSEEFLSLLTDFKLNNDITDNNFDYYATIKFCKSTFLNDFYNLSIIKTDSVKMPILLQHKNKHLVAKMDDSIFTELNSNEINHIVPVLKNEDIVNSEKMLSILIESTSFKTFLDGVNKEFGENFEPSSVNDVANKLLSFKIVSTLNSLEDTLSSSFPKEHTVRYHMEQLEADLSSEIFMGKGLSVYQLIHNFRSFLNVDEDDNSEKNKNGYQKLLDDYYAHFDNYFDLFKFQQTLKIGLLINAKTEEDLLNTPALEQFIATVKDHHPEWFKSLDESLVHSVTDDNAIRELGVPVLESTADFDLLSPNSFRLSAYPTHTDGYTHISGRYMGSEHNTVHLYGDNIFFKPYYHNLIIVEKNDMKLCTFIQTDIAYLTPDSKTIDYLLPVLEYLEKNQIILDLEDSNSTFMYQIKKEDLQQVVKDRYPNLIFLHGDIDMKKSIEVHHSKNFKEAFKIYKNSGNDPAVKSKIRNIL